jgi:hypothetical protein
MIWKHSMLSPRLRTVLQAAALASLAATAHTAAAANITTYHYDNQRTGWNPSETALTPATVASGKFGLLAQTTVDDQVDAQPLFVAGLSIAGGTHDVVYVATESNSVYAIDAHTGAVLLRNNFGPPVPSTALPGGCNNNGNNVGINSTPVIDTVAQRLYAITYTYTNSTQAFQIHALNLATLTDAVPPVTITASALLPGGSTYSFSAANSRQRPALLETSGNVYAGFGSFCDVNANLSRGWVLGWQAATLTPLPANALINHVPTADSSFFLSSVWMSGYGISSDDNGSLFFVTGNSDGNTYNAAANLSESAIRLTTDLTTVQGFFTPKNHGNLDNGDVDFGAGGIMVVPTQPGSEPDMAIAAGKGDALYLLNRDDLGGLAARAPTVKSYTNDGCWCGPSYYVGSDNVPRIVTSTGHNVAVWTLQTQPSAGLTLESSGPTLKSGLDKGFFTTVSSNGATANTAIIWALPHPANSDHKHTITLTAFDPANKSAQLVSAPAGTWPFASNANANLVPVVANGQVFVASYKQLSIFGLAPAAQHVAFAPPPAPQILRYTGTRHEVYGTAVGIAHDTMTLRTRAGTLLAVDLAAARASSDVPQTATGQPVIVRGDYDAAGNLKARYVLHAKNDPELWLPDR